MDVVFFENNNYISHIKMSKFQFDILICLNLIESVASRIKQTKIGIGIELKLKLANKKLTRKIK